MKYALLLFLLLGTNLVNGQRYQGKLLIEGNEKLLPKQIFISNLSQTKDELLQNQSHFDIAAQIGDVIRFSGISVETKDIRIVAEMLNQPQQVVQLNLKSIDIETVTLNKKLTGNLKKDLLGIKTQTGSMDIQNMLALPQAKAKQNYKAPSVINGSGENPVLNALLAPLTGVNPDAIYKLLSGDAQHERRLFDYEKNMNDCKLIRDFFGDTYFMNQGLTEAQIPQFLQYLYLTEDLKTLVFEKKYMALVSIFEKQLPIFKARLSVQKP
jgi:hypothetical protein